MDDKIMDEKLAKILETLKLSWGPPSIAPVEVLNSILPTLDDLPVILLVCIYQLSYMYLYKSVTSSYP